LPVYKRYIGPLGGGGANAVHDCQRRAFDQHDTGGLLPSPYVGGRAGEMSWRAAARLTIDFWTPFDNQLALPVSHPHSVTRSTSMESLEWLPNALNQHADCRNSH